MIREFQNIVLKNIANVSPYVLNVIHYMTLKLKFEKRSSFY